MKTALAFILAIGSLPIFLIFLSWVGFIIWVILAIITSSMLSTGKRDKLAKQQHQELIDVISGEQK